MSTAATDRDEQFMRRAIRLAMNGRGRVEPNPMVGCVIVAAKGQVIGEGFHQQFGGPHAEPNAIADCIAKGHSPKGATAYVTLEPCCHTNKKTPPCAPKLIEAGLARVVVGCLDPNPEVNGNGVAMLRAAGIRVDEPILEGPAKQLIAPFVARTLHRRPYVTLKWAQTADGMVAGPGKVGLVQGKRLQISNPASMRLVHQMRANADAILVGANTIQADDPRLLARDVEPHRLLLRAGLASRRGLFLNKQLSSTIGMGPIILYCTPQTFDAHAPLAANLARMEVEVRPVAATGEGLVDLRAVVADLYVRNVIHLMVEPGPILAESFFSQELVDRLWVFRSPKRLDEPGRKAAAVSSGFVATGVVDVEGDSLTEYLDRSNATYFAPEPSADLVLATEPYRTS